MSNPVAELAAELHDQPANPMRPPQVREHTEELDRLRAMAGGLDIDGQSRPWMPGDRGAARQRIARIQKVLHEQAPRPIEEGMRKDRVAKLVKQVRDEVIAPAMLTEEEMRRNPAGAVGEFMRREGSKPIKRAIMTMRRGMLAIEPQNDDPDYLNIERFRRRMTPTGASSFMAGAQLPGNFAMTPAAKANWALGEPTAETALSQVLRREQAEGAAIVATEPKKKRVATPEQIAALARGRATAKANREAANA